MGGEYYAGFELFIKKPFRYYKNCCIEPDHQANESVGPMADSESGTVIPLGWQALYMVSMFFGTFLSYMAPIVLIRRQQQQHSSASLVGTHGIASRHTYRVLSVCNCLSAGLFLGICFLNLIPYVEQEFDDIFRSAKYETDFPVGMCSVIAGLFLVLTLETLVMRFRGEAEIPVLHLDEEEDAIVSDHCLTVCH